MSATDQAIAATACHLKTVLDKDGLHLDQPKDNFLHVFCTYPEYAQVVRDDLLIRK